MPGDRPPATHPPISRYGYGYGYGYGAMYGLIRFR